MIRLSRYWLKGEQAGTSELFAILPGFPDNVRTNKDGDFWVAIHCRRNLYVHLSWVLPRLRSLFLKLPIPAKYHYLLHIGGKLHAVISKYSSDGKLLQIPIWKKKMKINNLFALTFINNSFIFLDYFFNLKLGYSATFHAKFFPRLQK